MNVFARCRVALSALLLRGRDRDDVVWVELDDGRRVRSRSLPDGSTRYFLQPGDLGYGALLYEQHQFAALALETPRRSWEAEREASERTRRADDEIEQKAALLDDLIENDITLKSFQDFKEWRVELGHEWKLLLTEP